MMNFQETVIDRSHQIPVVVDFWAPWCGPCRVLGPVIEALAAEQDTWELVKLNTEEEQEVSMQYGIRSIPNVKMFSNGEVIAEFAGALPRHQIMQWLDEHLPSMDKEDWKNLSSELIALDNVDAIARLESFLEEYPQHEAARLSLAKNKALKDPQSALDLLSDIKSTDSTYDLVKDIKDYAALLALPEASDDLTKQLIQSAESAKKSDFDATLKILIDVVMKDKSIHKDLPRRATIALFHLLGNKHPLTLKYRRLFDMALY